MNEEIEHYKDILSDLIPHDDPNFDKDLSELATSVARGVKECSIVNKETNTNIDDLELPF